jgi:hypothetical protein
MDKIGDRTSCGEDIQVSNIGGRPLTSIEAVVEARVASRLEEKAFWLRMMERLLHTPSEQANGGDEVYE